MIGNNPADLLRVEAPVPEPLNLRQREVLAQESIAKSLNELLMQLEWFFQYMRSR